MLRVSNRGISRSWMKGTLVVDTFHTIIFLKSWIYYINLYHCFNIFANISSRSTEHFTSRIPALEVTTKDCLWHHRAGAPGVSAVCTSAPWALDVSGCRGFGGVRFVMGLPPVMIHFSSRIFHEIDHSAMVRGSPMTLDSPI